MHEPILPNLLEPQGNEQPTHYADRIGRLYSTSRTQAQKRALGQFLTPVAVANFMASLVECDRSSVRILDPGAGSGVLACALVEHLAHANRSLRHVDIDAYEIDHELLPILDKSFRHLQARLRDRGIETRFRVLTTDFVLTHAAELQRSEMLFHRTHGGPEYDVVIGNPPYFKLPKSDPRAVAAQHVVHGQPNIYALFMAVSASLLCPSGQLVFITPRSFASGPYFKRFREDFFERVQLEALHVFDSRRDAFSRDGVLQENIIIKGRRLDHQSASGSPQVVSVSSSHGAADIGSAQPQTMPLSELLDMTSSDKMLRVASSTSECDIIRRIDSWTGSLSSYGMQVSTGPVVPFRAIPFISHSGDVPQQHVPLLWLQNVLPMRVEWPTSARRKPQYICKSHDAMSLLVPDNNYVLIRRFSAKEERRRLIAAPLLKGQMHCDFVGIENHVNYVHRPGGSLSEEEAWGLAVIYNCESMDSYFRVLNGSTQVSATEIRRIPLPPLKTIVGIGARAMQLNTSMDELSSLVETTLNVKPNTPVETLTHV